MKLPYAIFMHSELAFWKGRRLDSSRRAAACLSVLKPLRFGSILRSKYVQKGLRAAAGTTFVLFATWVAYELHLNLAATSLLQLLVVLAVALKVGFWHATVVSVLANFCLDYFFIPPVLTFHIADPQNWVALVVFEISALVVSRLSTEAKLQAVEATTRRGELEQLYEISRQLLLLGREQPLSRQILSLIQKVFLIEAGVLFDALRPGVELLGSEGRFHRAGGSSCISPGSRLSNRRRFAQAACGYPPYRAGTCEVDVS